MNTPWLPVPMPVEKTLMPGAETSGFRWPSPPRGPPELNDAKCRKVGLATTVVLSVAPVEAARVAPSVFVALGPCTPRNGMVTVYAMPVSGFELIGPS